MIVTTSDKPGPDQIARAERVAARCDVPYERRRGAPTGFAYVVGRNRDELRDGAASLTVHEGMLHARLQAGQDHPLIRAIGPAVHVVDGTLGIEGSPAIYSLLEEGIPRLAKTLAPARRIVLLLGEATATLAGIGSADAVFLAPMYDRARAATPGFELLRRVAVHDPFTPRMLEQAHRIAPRVVLKVDRGAPEVEGTTARIRGKSVDYVVLDRRGV